MVDITRIIVAIIGVLGAVITTFVIPLLNKKLTQQQMSNLQLAARIAVRAAEQLFTSEQWKDKKLYVQSLLADQGYNINTESVDAAIEAEVLSLHNQLKEGN